MRGKRLWWSVGLGAVTLLLLLATTGAAFADREPGALPGRFRAAESQPGDRLVYSLALLVQMPALQAGLEAGLQYVPGGYPGPGADQAFYMDADARLVLERGADRVLPTADGGVAAAASFITTWSSQDFDWDYGAGWAAWGAGSMARVQAEPWSVAHVMDRQVVAVTLPADRVGGDLPGRTVAQSLGVSPEGLVTLFESAPGPCGYASDVQGRAHELSKPMRVEGQCPPSASVFGDAPAEAGFVRVLASGHDDVRGERATVFADMDDPEQLRLWFLPDVPYPVRMLTQLFDLEGQIKMWLLYEMTQFQPGSAPAAEPTPVDPLLAPRHPWGPDESGVDHPFPLSAAWQAAIADGDLRDFLASHPDAQATAASFFHWEEDEATEERWTFTAADARSARAYDVTQRTAPVGSGTLPAALVGAVPLDPETTVTVQASDAPTGRVEAALLPTTMPGVVPTMQRWDQTGAGSVQPSAWAFQHCGACDASWSAAGFATSLQGNFAYSFLGLRPDGRPAFLEETDGPYQVPGEESPSTYGAASIPDSGSPDWNDPRGYGLAYAGIGVWSFPEPETAATAGFVAAFVGLLAYFLAPFVKGGLPGLGAVGLFSRIGRDEVLDHPLRSQIVSLVEAEPGLHFQELARRLDTGRGTLEHHLRKLVAADLLTTQPSQGFTCYFPKGKVDRRIMAAAPVLKSDGARLVLQAIANEPGRAAQDVAATTGLTPSTVNYHLKRLSGVGLVETIRRGRFTLLTPTSIGQQALGTWSGT